MLQPDDEKFALLMAMFNFVKKHIELFNQVPPEQRQVSVEEIDALRENVIRDFVIVKMMG